MSKELIERLRQTASRGTSVWGDLQLEAARALEALQAEAERLAQDRDEWKEATELANVRFKNAEAKLAEPVKFLANGRRFKLTSTAFNGAVLMGLPLELSGRWVALVAAEDDCHLKLTTPPAALAGEQAGIGGAQ